MQIVQLLEGSGLGPDEVQRLRCAYEATLRALHLVDRNDPIAEIVARKTIEIGKIGGKPAEIAHGVVKALGMEGIPRRDAQWPGDGSGWEGKTMLHYRA